MVRSGLPVEHIQEVLEEINSIIIGLDAEGRITFLNRFSEDLFGYSRDEALGKPLVGTFLPEKESSGKDNSGLVQSIIQFPAKHYINESEGIRKNGERVWISWSARLVLDEQGNAAEIFIDGNDVTQQHQQGLKAREAYEMINQSPDLVIRLDAKRRYLFVNRAFSETAGVPPEDILGKRGEVHLPKQTVKFITEALDRAAEAHDEITAEIPYGERWFLSTVKPVFGENERIESFMIFAKDITRRRHAAESALKAQQQATESEARFRTVLENSLDAAYRRDLRTDAYDYLSPVIEKITGYSVDEFASMDTDAIMSVIHPDDQSRVNGSMAAALDSESGSGRIVYRLKGKDGSYRWLSDNMIVVKDETGTPVYRVGNVRDVTQSMQLQEELQNSKETAEKRAREAEEGEQILEAILEHVPEGLSIVDAQSRKVLTVSRYLAQFVGKERGDFEGIPLAQYLETFNAARIDGTPIEADEAPMWRSIYLGETVVNEQYLLSTHSGEQISVLVNTAPILDRGGRIVGGIATWRNVEPLIQAEKELKVSRDAAEEAARLAEDQQRILEAILVSIPEAIIVLEAPEGRLRLASRYYTEFVGVAPEKLLESSMSERIGGVLSGFSGYRNGSESEKYPAARALAGETIMDEEWHVKKPDGSTAVISIAAAPVRDATGLITHAVVGWRDITVSKEMETVLRRSEHELKTLVESSPDIIIRMDRGMRYIFANATYERIAGVSRESLKGKTNQSLGMPEEQSRQWEETMRKVIRTGRETNIEFSFSGLFGTRFFWGRIIPEFDKNGMVESVMMVARDITERKRAEAHIRYVSFHDNVTGLYNRAYFEEEVNRLDTVRSLPVSFIMGDVNNLKLVNDAFGHNEGDILLKAIADILREACRESDIIARWGETSLPSSCPIRIWPPPGK